MFWKVGKGERRTKGLLRGCEAESLQGKHSNENEKSQKRKRGKERDFDYFPIVFIFLEALK